MRPVTKRPKGLLIGGSEGLKSQCDWRCGLGPKGCGDLEWKGSHHILWAHGNDEGIRSPQPWLRAGQVLLEGTPLQDSDVEGFIPATRWGILEPMNDYENWSHLVKAPGCRGEPKAEP